MKRTQFLDARRNIKKEFVAYLSIVVIGLLAALAYLVVAYSAATLRKDALHFFNENALWDVEVASTMLLDDEDLEAIRALPGVSEAEKVWQADARLRVGSGTENVTVMSLPEKSSLPILQEGALPAAAGECAVERQLAESCGFSVGQRIALEEGAASGIDPLAVKSFVITGIFVTPDHITFMVPVTPYLLVHPDSFDREALDGAFMKVRVRAAGAAENRWSDAYRGTVGALVGELNTLGAERGPVRGEKLRSVYGEQIREGEEQLEAAAEQLRLGREQLAEGQRELEAAAEELGLGKELLDNGAVQLRDATAQFMDALELLKRARAALETVHGYLDKGRDWILDHITEADWPPDAGMSYEEFRQALVDGEDVTMEWLYEKSGYNAGAQELASAGSKLESGRLDWYYLGEQYLDGLTRYQRGMKQFEAGERELAEGQAQYDEAQRQLEAAKAQIEKLGDGRWIVLDDSGNAGFVYADGNADKLASLSMSFSVIFLIVGALVIYATIGRMVEQQRKLVGATKAMGLFNREILGKYLFFACSGTLLGVGLGILLAWLPLQRVILRSYEKLFTYGEGTRSFLFADTGLVIAGALAVAVVAVYLGCSQLVRLPAIRLMQGEAPAGTRKKARKSAKGSLYARLILTNMRTDWKRVLVTVVSIAGGCLLMVVGFTLRYGIGGITARQFGGIQTYEAEIRYREAENPDAAAEIEEILDRAALPHVRGSSITGVFDANGTLSSMTVLVAEKGGFEGYFNLKDVDSGATLDLPDSGALVPRRFREYYGIGVGDSVGVYDSAMALRSLPVAAVFENYFGQLFFMTPEGYEEVFGAAPESNCIFVKTEGMPLDELESLVSGVAGFTRVRDAAEERTIVDRFSSSLTFVVWLMLFIAGVMACFIVANFTMTYIQRKTRELTIMRINGFTAAECIRYAAVDLVITTVLGTLLGLILGRFVGAHILSVTETPYIQMIREPAPQSFLFSAAITCGFSALVNMVALRKVRQLKLSDIS